MNTAEHPLVEVIEWCQGFFLNIRSRGALDLIKSSPQDYLKWWENLYKEAPAHIFIETGLIFFIIWLLFIRKTIDPNKPSKEKKMTEEEVDWLIDTWHPEPLVPETLSSTQQNIADSLLVRVLLYTHMLTMIQLWYPVSHLDLTISFFRMIIILQVIEEVKGGNVLKIRGHNEPVIHLSSYDFLGLSLNSSVIDVSKNALEKYGCGSCGPRGFYGTIDQHLYFEQAIAKFMGAEVCSHLKPYLKINF